MAEGKKSFVMYCDWITIFEELENEEAGKLIKHVFRYVNDQNPEAPDRLTKVVFTPIKQQFKRDLKVWENRSKKNAEVAKKRWMPKYANASSGIQNDANECERIKNDAKNADTVTDTVTVTVNDTEVSKKPPRFLVYTDEVENLWEYFCKNFPRAKEEFSMNFPRFEENFKVFESQNVSKSWVNQQDLLKHVKNWMLGRSSHKEQVVNKTTQTLKRFGTGK